MKFFYADALSSFRFQAVAGRLQGKTKRRKMEIGFRDGMLSQWGVPLEKAVV